MTRKLALIAGFILLVIVGKVLAECRQLTGKGYNCLEQTGHCTPYTAGPGSCGFFFKSEGYGGSPCEPAAPNSATKIAVCNKEISLLAQGWNDNIQSLFTAQDSECVMTQHENFGGSFLLVLPCYSFDMASNNVTYPSGSTGPYPQQYVYNLKGTTSIKCAPAGYFTQNSMSVGQGKAYCQPHYAGSSLKLTSATNLAYVGASWNDKFSSVKLGSKLRCTFYNDKDFKGASLVVNPNEMIYDLSSRGFNDKVSSIKCESCQ